MKNQENNTFEGFEMLGDLEYEKILQTPEQNHLNALHSLGIKVQSVFFPPNFHEVRDEKKVISWLYNNIQSLHTANYELRLKYANE
jgi:hypothetical protein